MAKLTVVAVITAKPGKADETQKALEALIPITLKEEGCINYDLHTSEDKGGVFLFYENWENRALWRQHMHNEHVEAFIAKSEELLDGEVELTTWHAC